MNLVKSIFVSLFMMAATVSAVSAVLMRDELGTPAAVALIVANGTVVGFFMSLMVLRHRARTPPRLVGMAAFITAAAVAGWTLADSRSIVVAVLALIPTVGWLVYDLWYSDLGSRSGGPLRVGASLPSFTLEEVDGTEVWSGDFRGCPALFVFYRGNWCPFCMAQIQELAGQYRELADRGVQVAFVSPQPHGHTRKLAERFDIPARFLVDPNNWAARDLGLDARFGLPMGMQVLGYDSETVMPTVILTDADEVILYVDLTDNYRVRPEPSDFLAVLDRTATAPAADCASVSSGHS